MLLKSFSHNSLTFLQQNYAKSYSQLKVHRYNCYGRNNSFQFYLSASLKTLINLITVFNRSFHCVTCVANAKIKQMLK